MPEFDSSVQYRPIEGFPGYCVSNTGEVWSCKPLNGRGPLKKHWHILNPVPDGHGRPFVTLRPGTKQQYVCRLVLEAFVGPCPEGLECCHFPDANPFNNHLTNLRWDTQKANANDSILQGIQVNGERCHTAKLTADKVRDIRRRSLAGVSASVLAKEFGVAFGNMRLVIRRKTWKHIH